MIRQLWSLSVHTREFLRRYMRINILLDAIRTRRGMKWGVPAMLLSFPYLQAASTFTTLIADGGLGWLGLLVLLCLWKTMRVIIMGLVSLILLVLTHVRVAQFRLPGECPYVRPGWIARFLMGAVSTGRPPGAIASSVRRASRRCVPG